MIDGTGSGVVHDSVVLVDGEKIIYAGIDRKVPEGYETIDIRGRTIMSGIIDAHLHFSGNITEKDTDRVMDDNIQKAVVAVQ